MQLPCSQAQRPPQSSVPGRHSIVHIISVHPGCWAAGTQLSGWQQLAGTQSASTAQAPAAGASPLAAGAGVGVGAGPSPCLGPQAPVSARRARRHEVASGRRLRMRLLCARSSPRTTIFVA